MVTTTQKIKKNLLYYLFAAVCAAAFFIHMFFATESEGLIQARNNWKEAKTLNTKYLNELKQLSFDYNDGKISLEEWSKQIKEVVPDYRFVNSAKNSYFKELESMKEYEKFLGFKNFQFFLGEFGWALGIFLFSLIGLAITFIDVKSEFRFGRYILYGTLLYIGAFYIYYTLQHRLDYPKYYYIVSMIICMFSLPYALSIISRKYTTQIESLKMKIRRLMKYIAWSRNNVVAELAAEAINKDNKQQVKDLVELGEDKMYQAFEDIAE